MTETPAAVAWIRRKMATRAPGQVLAIVATDGVWVDGRTMSLADYAAAYAGRARQEVRLGGVTLAELGAPVFLGHC